MRLLTLITLALSSLVYGDEGCLFPPCPPPPTAEEINSVNEMFTKAKYILGAAYDAQSKHYDDSQAYKNIPDFSNRTTRLKSDIKQLQEQAKKLNRQAGGVELSIALAEANMCVSYNKSASQYCTQSLNTLKSWVWEQQVGSSWSGYEVVGDWPGFPIEMR